MQVTVEETGVIERTLKITIPAEEIGAEINDQLKTLSRNARLPGFRPGKVPMDLLRKKYAASVTQEIILRKMDESTKEAVEQESLNPLGVLSIDPVPYEPGVDLQYTVILDAFPDIPVANLEGITIDKPVCQIHDADIDKTIDRLRERHAEFVDKGAPAEAGDRVVIDYEGSINGEAFADNQTTDFPLILGLGQMLEPFDDGIIGAHAGETRTVAVDFPEHHPDSELAGKNVRFEIVVKQVQRVALPEVDESLAQKFGVEQGGVEKLRDEVRGSMVRELNGAVRNHLRTQVYDALCDRNRSIEVPRAMVEREIDRMVESVQEKMGSPTDQNMGLDRGPFADRAREAVRLGLILREVVSRHQIELDADRRLERIEEMSREYNDPETFMKNIAYNETLSEQINHMVFDEQVVDTMLATAEVHEREVGFFEFMYPERDKLSDN